MLILIPDQVTYLGWWAQRYLREKFIERVMSVVGHKSLEELPEYPTQ